MDDPTGVKSAGRRTGQGERSDPVYATRARTRSGPCHSSATRSGARSRARSATRSGARSATRSRARSATRSLAPHGSDHIVDDLGDDVQHAVLVGDPRAGRGLAGARWVDVDPSPARMGRREHRLMHVAAFAVRVSPAGQEDDRPALTEGLVVHGQVVHQADHAADATHQRVARRYFSSRQNVPPSHAGSVGRGGRCVGAGGCRFGRLGRGGGGRRCGRVRRCRRQRP